MTTTEDTLSKLFRPGSGAHRIAETLLDGFPHRKADLVAATGVPGSTVPRVVKALRADGLEVSAALDGREAVYTVANAPGRSAGLVRGVAHRGDRVEVETVHGTTTITFATDGSLTVSTSAPSIT